MRQTYDAAPEDLKGTYIEDVVAWTDEYGESRILLKTSHTLPPSKGAYYEILADASMPDPDGEPIGKMYVQGITGQYFAQQKRILKWKQEHPF